MFYDLNIPYTITDIQLPRILAFLRDLGYNVIALNHIVTEKVPVQLPSIPDPLPSYQSSDIPSGLTILRRVTVVLKDAHPNVRLAELARNFDLLAIKATDERTLQLACSNIDCDIITIDLDVRYSFYFKYKMFSEAIRAGKKIEVNYGGGIVAGNTEARRNLIANATQLIRACRGRSLIFSSGAKGILAIRGPWDVMNLSTVWGLGQERAFEAVSKEPRNIVVNAKLKRTSYLGIVDVMYGGERPAVEWSKQTTTNEKKRKADNKTSLVPTDKPLSKTQIKKKARSEAVE